MTVTVKPFHQTFPKVEPLFHTYCDQCPEYGICGEQHEADASAAQHQFEHNTAKEPTA